MARTKKSNAATKQPITYKAQRAPLLRLPAELRNRIFDLVRHKKVCYKTVSYWSPGGSYRVPSGNKTTEMRVEPWTESVMFYSKAGGHARATPVTPLFARICKQIYCEEIQAFYANARFSFDTLVTLRAWLRAVSDEYLNMVRSNESQFDALTGVRTPGLIGGVLLKGKHLSIENLRKVRDENKRLVRNRCFWDIKQ